VAAPRPLVRPPRLLTLEQQAERHASWLELFFDLVFVVAIAQLSEQLVVDHTLSGFAIFAGLFPIAFIAWQGFSVYADRFDTDDLVFRVTILAAMLAIAALSVQIPDVARGETTGFALSYIGLRSLTVALNYRAYRHVPEARSLLGRYVAGYSIGVAFWVVSLFFDPPVCFVLWGVGIAWEYALPILVRRLHATIPIYFSHFVERYALFTIVVFGEVVVAVALGTAATNWNSASVAVAVAGFIVAATLWWTYFDAGPGSDLKRDPATIIVFGYGHIFLLAGLTAVSAGTDLAIHQASAGHLEAGSRWALCGGSATFLLSLIAVQWALAEPPPRATMPARALCAAGLAALAVVGGSIAPVVLAVLAATALFTLVAYEVAIRLS
jgi:low temperature requirement protein LtrA